MKRTLAAVAAAILVAGCGDDAVTPIVTETPRFVDASAGGTFTCGRTANGELYCWGFNMYGQLGDGSADPADPYTNFTLLETTPTAVAMAVAFTAFSAGALHACGIAGGQTWCWGRNTSGELGNGERDDEPLDPLAPPPPRHSTPSLVLGDHTFAQLSAGGNHTCALTASRQAYCWGGNEHGQLGDGTTEPRFSPVAVAGGHTFAQLSAGSRYTCGVTTAGAGYCWGTNERGELGDGGPTQRETPTAVSGGLVFDHISAGSHSCGLTTDGVVHCWGSENNYGELGDGTNTPRAALAPVSSGGLLFKQVRVNTDAFVYPPSSHACAITTADATYCWGRNSHGQLADPPSAGSERRVPTGVPGLSIDRLTLGGEQTCAISEEDGLYCWGLNSAGQVGDGTLSNRLTPFLVAVP